MVERDKFYDFSARTLRGRDQPFADYRGKVVLVVNTASECGFTPQYAGLEALHRKYRDRGLEILGFPCNQFGRQEPGDAGAIGAFCEANYGVSFRRRGSSGPSPSSGTSQSSCWDGTGGW